jgi:hypothetical protein
MQFSDADDPSKVIKFLAPCREMYEHASKCPVLGPVRDLYAEEKELRNAGKSKEADKLKKIAGFHWKKPTYYYQGFVVKGGMTEEESPENPIRVFPFNKMIHKMIFNSIFEAEEDPFETLPCGEFSVKDVQAILGDGEVDLDKFKGYNFIVKKGQRGEYADWTSDSGWSKSQTRLTDEQLAALAEHGLHDLTKRLPDRPSDENYDVLAEMMNLSVQRMVTGENGVWNKEWEELGFKPLRHRGQGDDATATSAPAKTSDDTPSDSGSGVSGALDRLKAARGKAAAAPVDDDDDDDSPADVAAAATDVTPTPEAKAETGVADLAAKIKARVGKTA